MNKELSIGICFLCCAVGIAALICSITKTPIVVIGKCEGGGCVVGRYDEHHPPKNQYDIEWLKETSK